MATVKDLSGNSPIGEHGTDNKLSSPNRTVAAVYSTITPAYVGEIVTDTTADVNYIGTGTAANTDWAVYDK